MSSLFYYIFDLWTFICYRNLANIKVMRLWEKGVYGIYFVSKQLILLYSGELGCLSRAYIQFSYKAPSHMSTAMATPWSTATTCQLNCLRIVGRLSQPVKGNTTPQTTCAKWSSVSGQPGHESCISEVNSFTSGQRNFWEEGQVNLNIPGAKGICNLLY